jgi:hypothetical protein
MIRKIVRNINEWVENRLRRIVSPLSTDTRLIVILAMLIIFSGLSIYMTVSTIYNVGKKNGQQMHVEHMERLELQQKQKADSINHKNKINYE